MEITELNEETFMEYASTIDQLRAIKKCFLWLEEKESKYLSELEENKSAFSKAYQRLRILEVKNNLPQISDIMQNTVKSFWDQYCALKKATYFYKLN